MRLFVVSGPERGRSFPLEHGQTLVVGRGQASDTKINDPYLCRIQCRVVCDGTSALVTDVSGGKTLYAGAPLPEENYRLACGDEFAAGNTVFRIDQSAVEAETGTVNIVVPKPAGKRYGPLKDLVGQTFGHFSLDEVAAQGKSGMVFKGTDHEKNRRVAIKVLSPDQTSSDEERERFVRAMRTMLPIRHHNLVALHAAGKNGPYCWAAMEWIDGESLTNVIKRIGIEGMLDWREVWKVAADVCFGLEKAHQEKIVHRNVMPDNILRRHSDKSCVLGDLMLAKALEGTQAKQLTRAGELIGEVAYMAPERTRDNNDIDGRSDIYGLGATLYALLAGRPPFVTDSLASLIKLIRDADPKPPKDYQLAINEQFQGMVMKMLAKNPTDRFQDPSAVLAELERVGRYQGLTLPK